MEYNEKNNITPKSIVKSITNILDSVYERDYVEIPTVSEDKEEYLSLSNIQERIKKLKAEMVEAAKNLEFEKAVELRDRMFELEEMELEFK